MNIKNAIILSGGTGSRLAPLTTIVNKQLLPLHDKFIIDYPLDTLKKMGCQNVTVIIGGNHFDQIVYYLKDGAEKGMTFNYVYQEKPLGIAQAVNLCKRYVADDKKFAVILGDNVFENPIKFSDDSKLSSQIVLHKHPEINRFGVASVDNNKKIVKIEEKPKVLDPAYENYAITGCYLFDQKYFEFFKKLTPSARGEYEITDIINEYNKQGSLGYAITSGLWSDAGTFNSIHSVSNFIFYKQKNHGNP